MRRSLILATALSALTLFIGACSNTAENKPENKPAIVATPTASPAATVAPAASPAASPAVSPAASPKPGETVKPGAGKDTNQVSNDNKKASETKPMTSPTKQ